MVDGTSEPFNTCAVTGTQKAPALKALKISVSGFVPSTRQLPQGSSPLLMSTRQGQGREPFSVLAPVEHTRLALLRCRGWGHASRPHPNPSRGKDPSPSPGASPPAPASLGAPKAPGTNRTQGHVALHVRPPGPGVPSSLEGRSVHPTRSTRPGRAGARLLLAGGRVTGKGWSFPGRRGA